MNQITDNISNDMDTVINKEEIVVDISSIETAENLDGVISGCVNRGEIHGDLNVGGIAGTMNIEYDGDPEYDVDTSESLNVRMRSTVNDVIIHCTNYGKVVGKMNCVGGIAGLQEMGFIYDSEGYGTVESSTGSYLGGIAGKSAGTVEKSYSLCNLTGTDSVGGICGSGVSIKDCISVSTIDSDGEKVGSVAGSLENGGTVKGNYFVGGELHGIDDISYSGVADRISYEEVMDMEGIPQGFEQVTVVFETEDEVLSEKQIAYGGSVSVSDLPVVSVKEGYYVEWPDEEELTDIRENLTVTAEYVPWTESVAGSVVDENGRNQLIVVGEFYEDTSIVMEETEGPEGLNEDATVVYAYTWALESEHEKEFQKLEAHFFVPETEDEVSVWVRQDETWQEVAVTEDGSYVVAEIPYGAAFAVVAQPADKNIFIIAAGVAVILLLVIFVLRHHNVRKGQRKAVV